jgi:catechol 2,3-dioxygenase-like lactoylglutathione lyase family enzyme
MQTSGWRAVVVFVLGVSVGLQLSSSAATRNSIKIGHVALNVADLQTAVDYYRRTWGFRDVFSMPPVDGLRSTVYLQVSRDTFLELQQSDDVHPPGFGHVGFEVTDMKSTVARLKTADIEVGTPRVGRSKDLVVSFDGPDAARLEIVQTTPGSLTRIAIDRWRSRLN